MSKNTRLFLLGFLSLWISVIMFEVGQEVAANAEKSQRYADMVPYISVFMIIITAYLWGLGIKCLWCGLALVLGATSNPEETENER